MTRSMTASHPVAARAKSSHHPPTPPPTPLHSPGAAFVGRSWISLTLLRVGGEEMEVMTGPSSVDSGDEWTESKGSNFDSISLVKAGTYFHNYTLTGLSVH